MNIKELKEFAFQAEANYKKDKATKKMFGYTDCDDGKDKY
jgi:hypothetical protein